MSPFNVLENVLIFKTGFVFSLVFLLMLTTQLEITREASALLNKAQPQSR